MAREKTATSRVYIANCILIRLGSDYNYTKRNRVVVMTT